MDINAILKEIDGYFGEGRPEEADRKLQEYLAQAKKENRPDIQLSLINEIIGMYRVTSRAKEAYQYTVEGLTLIVENHWEGTLSHGTTLLNGATALRAAGESEKAAEFYAEAAEIYAANPNVPGDYLAGLYTNISQIFQEKGEHEETLSYLDRAEAILEKMPAKGNELATVRFDAVNSLAALGRFDEAEEKMNQALSYYENNLDKHEGHYGTALLTAGNLAFTRKDYKKAMDYYQKAKEVTLHYYGENDAYRVILKNIESCSEYIK